MRLLLLFALSFAIMELPAATNPVADLHNTDHLRIRSWFEPAQGVPNQQILLRIEVATDRWFTGGTRIHTPVMRNAIIVQRNQFAVNFVRRLEGRSWTVQLWTLQLFFKSPGDQQMAPIRLDLSLAGMQNMPVTGSLEFVPPAIRLDHQPDSMINGSAAAWIASSDYQVKDQWSKGQSEVRVGDSLERQIVQSAPDMISMLFPEPAKDNLPGLAVYPSLPRLQDHYQRGDYAAMREDLITYVFEEEGDYRIPALSFFWWDTVSRSLRKIVLPGRSLTVGQAPGPSGMMRGMTWIDLQLLLYLACAVFAFYLLRAAWARQLMLAQSVGSSTDINGVAGLLLVAATRRDPLLLVAGIYRWCDEASRSPGTPSQFIASLQCPEKARQRLQADYQGVVHLAYSKAPVKGKLRPGHSALLIGRLILWSIVSRARIHR